MKVHLATGWYCIASSQTSTITHGFLVLFLQDKKIQIQLQRLRVAWCVINNQEWWRIDVVVCYYCDIIYICK